MSIADELAKEFLYHNDLYRAGRSIISDKQFDAIKQALIKSNPKHPALKKVEEGCVLSGLGTLPFAEWYSYLPKNTPVIVEPKIDGCAMAVRYVDGLLVKAWTRKGIDKTYCMRMIEDLPKHIIAKGTVDIRGELYGKGLYLLDHRDSQQVIYARSNHQAWACLFVLFKYLMLRVQKSLTYNNLLSGVFMYAVILKLTKML